MSIRSTRESVEAGTQQIPLDRITRESIEVGTQQIPLDRLTRMEAEIGTQTPPVSRLTRASIEVAVGFISDQDLGGRRWIVRKRITSPATRS
jgi:hypothetical protein